MWLRPCFQNHRRSNQTLTPKWSNILYRVGGWSTPCICAESASSAVLHSQHLPGGCEWKSHNSEGVFRQLCADAWPRDQNQGHDMEMTGDELRRWQLESKHEVYYFMRSYIVIIVKYNVVWTFHVMLFKYYDLSSVWLGGNLDGK